MKLQIHITQLLQTYDLAILHRPALVRRILFDAHITPSLGQLKATIKRDFRAILEQDSLPRCFNGYCSNQVHYSGNLCTQCQSEYGNDAEFNKLMKEHFKDECLFPGKCSVPSFHFSSECIEAAEFHRRA